MIAKHAIKDVGQHVDAGSDGGRRDAAEPQHEAIHLGRLDREAGDRRDGDAARLGGGGDRRFRQGGGEVADRMQAALGRRHVEQAAEPPPGRLA